MREFWRIVGGWGVGGRGLWLEGGLVCSYFCGVGGKKFDGGIKAKPGLILVILENYSQGIWF